MPIRWDTNAIPSRWDADAKARGMNALDIRNMRLPANSVVMVLYKLLFGHLHLFSFFWSREGRRCQYSLVAIIVGPSFTLL